MVTVELDSHFEKTIKKIKDKSLKNKVFKQIEKIIDKPTIGKPMKHARKGTREVYIPPFRLSYFFYDDTIIFLDLYHKDRQ